MPNKRSVLKLESKRVCIVDLSAASHASVDLHVMKSSAQATGVSENSAAVVPQTCLRQLISHTQLRAVTPLVKHI